MDDISIVKQFSQTLSKEKIKEKEIKIILRPHPGYYGSELKDWCSINNIYFSDSHNESSSRFLEDINLLISNQSSIHLDSVIMRRPSFIYNFSNKEVIDWYDYLKNGLVEEIHSLEELLERLNSESTSLPQDELIQYYNASYKKRFEGNVTKIVTSFLESLIDRRNHIFYESYITKVIEKGDNYNVMTII